jgi:hypothetical protein
MSSINVHLIPGCPPCETSFRLCLKEYQGVTQPGELSGLIGCAFGNASTPVLGSSSFVLSEPEVGAIVLPFTFRWTVSITLNCFFYFIFIDFIANIAIKQKCYFKRKLSAL